MFQFFIHVAVSGWFSDHVELRPLELGDLAIHVICICRKALLVKVDAFFWFQEVHQTEHNVELVHSVRPYLLPQNFNTERKMSAVFCYFLFSFKCRVLLAGYAMNIGNACAPKVLVSYFYNFMRSLEIKWKSS